MDTNQKQIIGDGAESKGGNNIGEPPKNRPPAPTPFFQNLNEKENMTIEKSIETLKNLKLIKVKGNLNGQFLFVGLPESDLQAIENVLAELEKKDKKLKDIEKHIETEIMMIEKTYNEVGLFAQKQYEGMRASYKCLLNVFFARKEVEK